MSLCRANVGNFYVMPTERYQPKKDEPIIRLIFYPTKQLNNNNLNINYYDDSQISFRLVGKSSRTITNDDLAQLKSKIQELFFIGTPFIWHKGKTDFHYNDESLGYNFRLLCIDEKEAQRIITKVMEIRGHVPDWKKLFINNNAEPTEAYPAIPEKEIVLGEIVEEPLLRPDIKVQYKHSEVIIRGKGKPKRL